MGLFKVTLIDGTAIVFETDLADTPEEVLKLAREKSYVTGNEVREARGLAVRARGSPIAIAEHAIVCVRAAMAAQMGS